MTTVTCGCGRKGSSVLPLDEDPWFTSRFAADRTIPRFHLEGVEAGRRVSFFRIDAGKVERLGLLATATGGEGGWVEFPEPIIVRAGEGFSQVISVHFSLCLWKNSHIRSLAETFLADLPMKPTGGCRPGQV